MIRPDGPRGVRFGANYTPSDGWFHSWYRLDRDAVRRDMESIAGLGLDHVRVLPLWEILQPNRTLIRPEAVADVVAVVDAAAEFGLDASVDVLQGHLSSYDFLPSWVVSWHRRGIFTDPDVVAAQEALVTTLGSALDGRGSFLGLTVGNETNQFAKSVHPDPQPLDEAGAGAWLDRLLAAARAASPTGRHTHSYDDDVWFVDDSAVTPDHAVTRGDLTTVHSWVFTGVARHYPIGHPAYEWFARYLLELASGWSGDPVRPVWLQEVGAPTPHLGADRVASFAAGTVDRALRHDGLWGVTWWCSHDVSRSLADFPELEYSLGLLGADRSVKPLGATVRDLVAAARREGPATARDGDRPTMEVPSEGDGTVLRSRTAPGSEFFTTWVEAAEAGHVPRIVVPHGARAAVRG